ncbi:MAG: hypothetical protein H7Y00_07560, partial [Fimbriimonadaceae bacterium]|nr:hypothetical protein [Chitinophagales bacterium]
MKHLLTLYFLLLLLQAPAQVNINFDSPVTVTFGSTVTGVSAGSYTASGFVTSPGTGRLDSDAWSVTGFTGGDLSFGGSVVSGSLAMGTVTMLSPTTDVGATIGGMYSYTGPPFSITDPALLVQPTDTECTPGTIILKVKNNHVSNTIYLLDIVYDLWVRNNTNSSNKISFSWSEDAITYTSVPGLDYTSATTAVATGIVSTGSHFYTIVGCDVTPGEFIYLKWSFTDVSGIGERDEFYFDDFTVTAPNLLPIELIDFTATQIDKAIELNWATVSETDNDYFVIEKSDDGFNSWIIDAIGELNAIGNTTAITNYAFTDDAPKAGINYYRLKQVDINGNIDYSKIISVLYTNGAEEDVLIYPNPASNFIFINKKN